MSMFRAVEGLRALWRVRGATRAIALNAAYSTLLFPGHTNNFPGMAVIVALERIRLNRVCWCRLVLATLWETGLDFVAPESFHVHMSFLSLTKAGPLCDTAHRETQLPGRWCVVFRFFWPIVD